MPLRYYPLFRIIKNQNTSGEDFILEGLPYVGKYYITYDGKAYTGPDPITGPNQLLTRVQQSESIPITTNQNIPYQLKKSFERNIATPNVSANPQQKKVTQNKTYGAPTPYYPFPIESDYQKGYIIRYFTKKENSLGYIIEISEEEYNSILNGTANYDISIYQTTNILWKLTGPLNTIRLSQYDIRAGIIDTNKRLVEKASETFLGLVDFIGGDYTKWSRPDT